MADKINNPYLITSIEIVGLDRKLSTRFIDKSFSLYYVGKMDHDLNSIFINFEMYFYQAPRFLYRI